MCAACLGDVETRPGSTLQSVSPSALLAAARWVIPVRSSTRARSNVSQSSLETPGLKTALTVLGQSAAVRIGFPS